MRVTNHHGRGSAKHAGRDFDLSKAPHIDPAKSKRNHYWTWDGGKNLEQSELSYYRQVFSDSLDAQNAKHIARRQKKRVRTMEEVYHDRQQQPEGSLLYIGDKSHKSEVPSTILWKCVIEYVKWEREFSKAHKGFYQPLSLALHVDEEGAYHVEERSVYRWWDGTAWNIGQNKALEMAGIPLPDPSKPRSKNNNRKMVWDSMRREKWLDIVESHGYTVERTPDKNSLHLPLEAWQAYQDLVREEQEAIQKAVEARQKAVERLDGMTQPSFEEGFLAYPVGDDGRTVGDWINQWMVQYKRKLQEDIQKEAAVDPVPKSRLPEAAREAIKKQARKQRIEERDRKSRSVLDSLDDPPPLDPSRFHEVK